MKKLIFVLLAGSLAMTSCDKETSLGNKLEDQWDISSLVSKVTTNKVDWYTGSKLDSTTTPEASSTVYTTVATGTVDFVSDDVVTMSTSSITTATTTSNGTVTTVTGSPVETEFSSEYFATGEDEVILVSGGSYVTYEVTTNESDEQVWVTTDTQTDENWIGSNNKTISTVITVTTLSLKKAE
jgi:hypothetical protein